jgi:hypothetical protein
LTTKPQSTAKVMKMAPARKSWKPVVSDLSFVSR